LIKITQVFAREELSVPNISVINNCCTFIGDKGVVLMLTVPYTFVASEENKVY